MTESISTLTLVGVVALIIHGLGFVYAISAIWYARTSQGATAWAISLVTFPYVALPLFLVFGQRKFEGYVQARRSGDRNLMKVAKELEQECRGYRVKFEEHRASAQALEALAKMPFTCRNDARVLIDGEATFEAIFEAIDRAERYILLEFFIVRDDDLGQRLKRALIAKAKAGVMVYFMFDEIGSRQLPNRYIDELVSAGIRMTGFGYSARLRTRFQINFRNHRKIVVVDGKEAFLGGLNVGDEYLGKDRRFSPWRDTHLAISGPAALGVQLAFLEDWHWATGEIPQLSWTPVESPKDRTILVLPTGPADELETCELFFVHALHSAQKRIWIATPYFVPSGAVISALQLAALRGVDVRILVPSRPDHFMVYLASYTFLYETVRYGIKVYRYKDGFMHQKVMLVDDDVAAVSSANFDNRSFRLNFELTALVVDRAFATDIEKMLDRDLAACRPFQREDLERRPFWFRLSTRVARLFGPIL